MGAPALPKRRILVVDDEPFVCEAVKMMLAFDGHVVETATSGKDALAKFDQSKFVLVITDISMPAELFSESPKLTGATRRIFRGIAQTLLITLLAVGSYLFVSHFVVQSVRVVGLSMAPTLADSQVYLLNRWVFHLRAPQPTEVVVLRDPTDGSLSVKRVIAISGDSVLVKDGGIFLNGRRLEESYLRSEE